MHWFDGGHAMGWMWIWWVLGVIVIVAAIWTLTRSGGRFRGRDRGGPERESPEEILKRRYASGEIDRDEYEARRRDL